MKNLISVLKSLPFENKLCSLPIDHSKQNNPRKVQGFCFCEVCPEQKDNPQLIAYSPSAFTLIDVDLDPSNKDNIQILAGNLLPDKAIPLAHCYCGYQFGNWAGQLGDGRAIYLGDLKGHELQLKGAGLTPFSRFADGKAVIRSSLREYLCSEFMHSLRIPTTRAASLVITDTKAERDIFYNGNQITENCAVVLRIAETFFRFGSFEVEVDLNPKGSLVPQLWDYCEKNFFKNVQEPFLEIVKRTAKLVAQWQCYGFTHGVLNTDNMSIVGLTIDYGPYGFMEYFNRNFISNHSDKEGRYSYSNQPQICFWNLLRLCEALDSVIPQKESTKIVKDFFWKEYYQKFYHTMLRKLGLVSEQENQFTESQHILVDSLFNILHQCCTNYTKVYQLLQQINIPYQTEIEEEVFLDDNDNLVIDKLLALSAPREVYLSMRKPQISKEKIIQLQQLASTSKPLLAMMGINEEWLNQQIQKDKEYDQLVSMPEQQRLKIMKLLWTDWIFQYKAETNQKNRIEIMDQMNPKYTITNTVLQYIIEEVEQKENYQLLQNIQKVIENPFAIHKNIEDIFNKICNNEICVSCSS